MTYAGYAVIKVTNNTSTDLTDFQVKLTLDSNNFQYWEALRDDGIDIYFTLSDGLTEVSFWRESFDKTNKQATFWIKVPSVVANSYTTLYMYFVNPNETIDRSNGVQTFEFFDDFDNLDNWTVLGTDGTGTASISNSQLILTSPAGNAIIVCHQISISPNNIGYIIGTKVTGLSITDGFTIYYGDGTGRASNFFAENCYAGGYFRGNNTKHYICKQVNDQYTSFTSGSVSTTQNVANYIEFGWYSNILTLCDFTHNVQLKASDSTFNSFDYIHLAAENGKWTFDYVYVRKYITNSTDISEVNPLFEPLIATVEEVTLTLRTVSATLTLNNVQQYVDTFIGDGSTTTFTLSKKPIIPKVRVFIDDIEVDETKVVVDYTNGMITLNTAPASNSTVLIVYYYGDFSFIPNTTIKVLISNMEFDTTTTDQYGKYTVKVPINIEVGLKAETNKSDSITIVKLTE